MPAKKYNNPEDVKSERIFIRVTKAQKAIYLRSGGSSLVREMIEKLNITEQQKQKKIEGI